MTKWKLFKKSKRKEDTYAELETVSDEIKDQKKTEETPPIIKEETEETPVKEYTEVLYSRNAAQKQPTSAVIEKREQLKRTSWESPNTIEHNVDAMKKQPPESNGSGAQSNTLTDKKVDCILSKKKMEL